VSTPNPATALANDAGVRLEKARHLPLRGHRLAFPHAAEVCAEENRSLLVAGNFPRHRTLCEFRRRHLEDFGAVFAEVVRLAQTMGLAGLGRVSVDGTKVRANASKRKAMSYGRMVKEERRLQAEIAGLLEEAEAVDTAEDAHYGEDVRGDELPEEPKRREDRLARRRRPAWKLGSGRRTTRGAASRVRSATQREDGPTSGSTASRRRWRRATSRTPRAGS